MGGWFEFVGPRRLELILWCVLLLLAVVAGYVLFFLFLFFFLCQLASAAAAFVQSSFHTLFSLSLSVGLCGWKEEGTPSSSSSSSYCTKKKAE